MANPKSFPLVRGRSMRVSKTDGCCTPAFGASNTITTEGFVSVALTAKITDAEEITVTNASGKTCVRDTGAPTFDGYDVELTFCEVQPCLFSMITGQPLVYDVDGNIVGFKMNSKVALNTSGFSLEVWMGVPGAVCSGDDGAYGYLLLPCLQGGIVGDFTIENAAITFTITGASTKDGNGWGTGPFVDTEMFEPLDEDDHLYVIFTTTAPPEPTDGCDNYAPPGLTAEIDSLGTEATLSALFTGTFEHECLTATGGASDPTISWGDGAEEVWPQDKDLPATSATHTYTANGTYVVTLATKACGVFVWELTVTGWIGVRTTTTTTAAVTTTTTTL